MTAPHGGALGRISERNRWTAATAGGVALIDLFAVLLPTTPGGVILIGSIAVVWIGLLVCFALAQRIPKARWVGFGFAFAIPIDVVAVIITSATELAR